MAHGHGGRRAGSGRPAKALRYAHDVAAQERKLVSALPEMIDVLLKAASGGDTAAARYCVDRVLGRVQTQAVPIAEDDRLPFDHPAADEVVEISRRRTLAKKLTPTRSDEESRRILVATEHMIAEAEVEHESEDQDVRAAHLKSVATLRPAPSPPSPFAVGPMGRAAAR